MDKKEKTLYIVVTAVITAIITWTLCNDNNSVDKVYLKDLQDEIDMKDERIKELENSKSNDLEEKLNSIEGYLDEIGLQIEDIYEQTVPKSVRNNRVYDFIE